MLSGLALCLGLATTPQLVVTLAAGEQGGVSPALDDVRILRGTLDLDAQVGMVLSDNLTPNVSYVLQFAPSVRGRLQLDNQTLLLAQNSSVALQAQQLGDRFTSGFMVASFSTGDTTLDQLPASLQNLVGVGQASVIGIFFGSVSMGVSRRFTPRTSAGIALSTSLQVAPVFEEGADADLEAIATGQGVLQHAPQLVLDVNHNLSRSIRVGAALRADAVVQEEDLVYTGALASINRTETAFRLFNVRLDLGAFVGGGLGDVQFAPSFSLGVQTLDSVNGLRVAGSLGLAPNFDPFIGELTQRAGLRLAVGYDFGTDWQAALDASGFFAAFPDSQGRSLAVGTLNLNGQYRPQALTAFVTFGVSGSLRELGPALGENKGTVAADLNFFVRVGGAAIFGGQAQSGQSSGPPQVRAPSLL